MISIIAGSGLQIALTISFPEYKITSVILSALLGYGLDVYLDEKMPQWECEGQAMCPVSQDQRPQCKEKCAP